MTGDPIELNREEVKGLWKFMENVEGTLLRVEKRLDDHEERIRANHEEIVSQRSERAFTRWMLPVIISLGAFAVATWSMLRKNGA